MERLTAILELREEELYREVDATTAGKAAVLGAQKETLMQRRKRDAGVLRELAAALEQDDAAMIECDAEGHRQALGDPLPPLACTPEVGAAIPCDFTATNETVQASIGEHGAVGIAPPLISDSGYTHPRPTYRRGEEIATNAPRSFTGSSVIFSVLHPAVLPDGLVLDPATGAITGTTSLDAHTGTHALVVAARNSAGVVTCALELTVPAFGTAPPGSSAPTSPDQPAFGHGGGGGGGGGFAFGQPPPKFDSLFGKPQAGTRSPFGIPPSGGGFAFGKK